MSIKPPHQHPSRAEAAELQVAAAMQARGWRVVARNFRRRGCELDLVAAKGATLAIVEVKARQYLPQDARSFESLLPAAKRQALQRGAHAFLARFAHDGVTVRYDLAVVLPKRTPTTSNIFYFVNIFEELTIRSSR